jgi:iron complex transport system substrate-binding protein
LYSLLEEALVAKQKQNTTERTRGLRMSAVSCALFVVLAGAATPNSAQASEKSAQAQPASTMVIDGKGRRVNVPARIDRIVTISPDLTETIYALGLDDKLVGDTSYCDVPAAAKLKPHVGSPKMPSLEAIAALHPDIVLASTSINDVQTADSLTRVGIPVYTTDPQTVRGLLESISNVANVLGAAAQGQALVNQLQTRLDALRAKLMDQPLAHVFFVVWESPLITIGQNTFIADALRFAGAESVILADQKWPQISFEEVVRVQPDYIVFTANHGDSGELLSHLRTQPAWKGLHAVEMGHVVTISDEIARPSVGLIGAVEELAHDVHPEVFSSTSPSESTPGPLRHFAENERLQTRLSCREESAACAR